MAMVLNPGCCEFSYTYIVIFLITREHLGWMDESGL